MIITVAVSLDIRARTVVLVSHSAVFIVLLNAFSKSFITVRKEKSNNITKDCNRVPTRNSIRA